MCARDEPCSSPINPFRTAVSNVIQACHGAPALSVLEHVSFACYTLASESGTIGIAGACLVGSGRFFLHVPTHCTWSNVYVHESARGARDVARSMFRDLCRARIGAGARVEMPCVRRTSL